MPHTFDATLKDMLAPDPVDLVPAFGLPHDEPAVALDVDLSTLSAANRRQKNLGQKNEDSRGSQANQWF
jgi:hypothetical protein